MYLLTSGEINLCETSSFLEVIYIIKLFITLLKVIVPLILITTVIIDVSKVMMSDKPEELTKQIPIVSKRIIAALLIFVIPTLIDFTMTLAENSDSGFSACYTNADKSSIESFRGKELDEEERKKQEAEEEKRKQTEEDLESARRNQEEKRKRQEEKKREEEKKQEEEAQNNASNGSTDNSLFVGDSRTVGLGQTVNVGAGSSVYATSGGTIGNFNSDVAQAINVIKSNPNKKYNLVLNYGVNDLGDDYVTRYKEIINEVGTNTNILIVSVNPCNDSIAKYCRNSNIETFNSKLKSNFQSGYSNVKYCDTYTEFKNQSNYLNMIETKEGIHYTKEGYNFIYNKIASCLKSF